MANWLNNLRADKRQVKDRIIQLGQAEAARKAGVSEMMVSRFVRGRGSNAAADFYQLANGVGLTVLLVPAGSKVWVEGELFTRASGPDFTRIA